MHFFSKMHLLEKDSFEKDTFPRAAINPRILNAWNSNYKYLYSFENILYSYKNADSGHKSFFLLNQWNMWNENWYLFVHSSGSKGFSIWHNIVISWIFVAKIEQKRHQRGKKIDTFLSNFYEFSHKVRFITKCCDCIRIE